MHFLAFSCKDRERTAAAIDALVESVASGRFSADNAELLNAKLTAKRSHLQDIDTELATIRTRDEKVEEGELAVRELANVGKQIRRFRDNTTMLRKIVTAHVNRADWEEPGKRLRMELLTQDTLCVDL